MPAAYDHDHVLKKALCEIQAQIKQKIQERDKLNVQIAQLQATEKALQFQISNMKRCVGKSHTRNSAS